MIRRSDLNINRRGDGDRIEVRVEMRIWGSRQVSKRGAELARFDMLKESEDILVRQIDDELFGRARELSSRLGKMLFQRMKNEDYDEVSKLSNELSRCLSIVDDRLDSKASGEEATEDDVSGVGSSEGLRSKISSSEEFGEEFEKLRKTSID